MHSRTQFLPPLGLTAPNLVTIELPARTKTQIKFTDNALAGGGLWRLHSVE